MLCVGQLNQSGFRGDQLDPTVLEPDCPYNCAVVFKDGHMSEGLVQELMQTLDQGDFI